MRWRDGPSRCVDPDARAGSPAPFRRAPETMVVAPELARPSSPADAPADPSSPGSVAALFLADVHAGLARDPKTLPSRWLYDDAGAALFEAITALPEYYPTRTETAILAAHAAEMLDGIGPGAAVVEYGAGARSRPGCCSTRARRRRATCRSTSPTRSTPRSTRTCAGAHRDLEKVRRRRRRAPGRAPRVGRGAHVDRPGGAVLGRAAGRGGVRRPACGARWRLRADYPGAIRDRDRVSRCRIIRRVRSGGACTPPARWLGGETRP